MKIIIENVVLLGFSDNESDREYLRGKGYSDEQITAAFVEAKTWQDSQQSPQSA